MDQPDFQTMWQTIMVCSVKCLVRQELRPGLRSAFSLIWSQTLTRAASAWFGKQVCLSVRSLLFLRRKSLDRSVSLCFLHNCSAFLLSLFSCTNRPDSLDSFFVAIKDHVWSCNSKETTNCRGIKLLFLDFRISLFL